MASSDKKKVHRFGAFLRLYGPRGAPTHAKLVLGHEPRPGTPEAFLDELVEERDLDYRAHPFSGYTIELRAKLVERTPP
jgi:hypothetical protein